VPHRTCRFHFEGKILSTLRRLLQPLDGLAGSAASLLLVLNPDSSIEIVIYPKAGQPDARLRELETLEASFIFYDPFERPDYEFLKWANVGRDTMEMLMGDAFSADDFDGQVGFYGPVGDSMAYPKTWGVMF
jgi:hypothetical protein